MSNISLDDSFINSLESISINKFIVMVSFKGKIYVAYHAKPNTGDPVIFPSKMDALLHIMEKIEKDHGNQ